MAGVTESSAKTARARSGRWTGAVLILALVMTGMTAALVLRARLLSAAHLRLARAQFDRVRVDMAAQSAVRVALQRLAEDEDLLTDHTNEAWAVEQRYIDPAGIDVRCRVYDVCARFDLNNLSLVATDGAGERSESIAMDLLTLCGDYNPVAVVSAWKDWVDEDQEGVYEGYRYEREELDVRPPDQPALCSREWTLTMGASRAYWNGEPRDRLEYRLKPRPRDLFCTAPMARKAPMRVNVNTASAWVLTGVFGLEHESLVRYIVDMRSLTPLQDLSFFSRQLSPADIERIEPFVDVKSGFYRVEAAASEGRVKRRVFAYVQRAGDGTVQVLDWIQR